MPHECTTCNRTFPDGSKEMLSGCPDCGGNKFRYRPDRSHGERQDAAADPGGTAGSPATGDTHETPPAGTGPGTAGSSSETSDASGPVSRARTTVREWVGRGSEGEADASTAPPDRTAPTDQDPIEAPREETADPAVDEGASGTDASARPGTGPSTETADPTAPADAGPDHGVEEPTEAAVDAEMADSEDTAQASARSSVVDPDELPDRSAASTVPPSGGEEPAGDDDRPDLSELREELNDQFESIKIVEPGQYELNLMELYDRQEYIISLQEDGRYVIEVPESWRSGSD